MAHSALRALPRLLTSIYTTPILRATPKPRPQLARSISNFPGLQGVVQPWRAAPMEREDITLEDDRENIYLEALQRWQDEADALRDIRILPVGVEDESSEAKEQLQELLASLAEEEEVLDIRRGWVLTANY